MSGVRFIKTTYELFVLSPRVFSNCLANHDSACALKHDKNDFIFYLLLDFIYRGSLFSIFYNANLP